MLRLPKIGKTSSNTEEANLFPGLHQFFCRKLRKLEGLAQRSVEIFSTDKELLMHISKTCVIPIKLKPVETNLDLFQFSFCVCVKRKTLCNCLCSSSCDSASLIQNIGEFGAKKYFTDHRTANTIQSFQKRL